MPTLQTPIANDQPYQAVPIEDPNQGALEQVGGAAEEIAKFGFAQIKAQNTDRLIQTQADATKQLDDLKLSFANDTDPTTAESRFADKAAQIHDQMASGLTDVESRQQFSENFNHLAEARQVDVASAAQKNLSDDANANLRDSLDTYSDQAAAATNPNERYAIVKQAGDAIENAVGSKIIKAEVGQQLGKSFKGNLALLDARRAIDADPAQGVAAIKANAFPDLDPLKAEQEIERGEAETLARQRQAQAALRDQREDARMSLDDLETVNRSGLPPSQAQLDNAGAAVAASQDRVLRDRYNRTVRVSNFLTGLRGATPGDVQNVITNLEQKATAGGADATMAAGVTAARQYAAAQTVGLRDDPLGYAQAQGRAIITPLGLNGQDDAQAWQDRIQQAERVASYYGTKPTYLTKQESDTLKGALASSQPVNTRMAIAKTLVDNLGSRALSVFASVAPNDPVVANAGALMVGGNQTAARDAMTGQGLLHNSADGKQSDLRPSPAGRSGLPLVHMLTAATGIAGEAGRGQILSTADAIYAARAPAMGLTGASVGNNEKGAQDLYEHALNEAAGGRYDVSGNQWGGLTKFHDAPVIAPAGILADHFEDAVTGMNDRQLVTHSVGGGAPMIGNTPIKAADMSRLYLMSVGDDTYAISTTDPRQAVTPVHDAKGGIYKFSLMRAYDHAAPQKNGRK